MLKGGVIMDVTNPEQAKIAEDAGAVAVMALERVPADIRKQGGVARMADPEIVTRIMDVVSIPVMAKCRIGHFAEARVLEALGVDFIDESEVLTPADDSFHVDKFAFKIPFVCGCRDLGRGPAPHRRGRRARAHEGRGRHRQRRRGRAAHAHRGDRHPPAHAAPARGADDRGEEPRRPVRAGQARRADRQAAGAQLRRGRHRDACGRSADDGARRRVRVRRLRASSSRTTRRRERRRSCARPRTGRTRRSSRRSRAGLGDAMAGLETASLPEAERLATRGW